MCQNQKIFRGSFSSELGTVLRFSIRHLEQTLLKLSPCGFCVENMNNAHSTGSLLLPVLYSS